MGGKDDLVVSLRHWTDVLERVEVMVWLDDIGARAAGHFLILLSLGSTLAKLSSKHGPTSAAEARCPSWAFPGRLVSVL